MKMHRCSAFGRPLVKQVFVVSLLVLLAGCNTELYSNLVESEANEMIAVLAQRGISASKERSKEGTETISVDKSHFADAVALLRDRGYPRKKFESIADAFPAGGLVASPMQDRARFLYALSQELSRTVSEIDGVLTARVQVVLPDNDIMQRAPVPSSASVFVRYDARSKVDQLVPQIKMLVANSVEGLSYDKVAVVLVAASPVPVEEIATSGFSAMRGIAIFGAFILLLGGFGYTFREWISDRIDRVRNGRSIFSVK